MPPVILRYPLDPTGVSLDNLVSGEPHVLPNRTTRVVATSYGAFFADSLRVFDITNNRELVRGISFQAVEMYELPSAKFGKEICAVVLITDQTVSSEVSLTYQALGGDFSLSADAVVRMFESLAIDNRPVAYPSIINLPAEFPPVHHLHDIGDVYGFEYMVHALERIVEAIRYGDTGSHDRIYRYIDSNGGSGGGVGSEDEIMFYSQQ